MTFRIAATPLSTPAELPAARQGGFPPELLDACISAPGAEGALRRLREPGVLVVTTGQQPALFTGPLYSVHKALSAAALARLLEERWERPVVPLFWSAGDDHDWAEADHASWPTTDGAVRTVRLRERAAEAPLLPLSREPLGPEVLDAVAAFAADHATAPFGGEAVAWLRRHFHPEATVARASAEALAELLAPAGVVCLDTTHPAMKRAAARHLVRSLGLARDLDRDLSERARQLAEIGHDAGVPVGDGAALVMLEGRHGRDRLISSGDGFVTRRGREHLDLAALQRIAAAEPERLSANVLLRPVVESALLPTVAYVAGPGELRYLELTPPIYQRLRVLQQQPVPRWSGVVVGQSVDRVLGKFGIELGELMRPAGALESRIVRSRLASEIPDALDRLRSAVDAEYGTLARHAHDIDPTLVRMVNAMRRHALTESERVEAKLVRHLKRRESVELTQLARARATVAPLGKPQERVVTAAALLARHGPTLVPRLLDAIRAWYADALEGRLVAS